ncbi:MAG: hypothetical protein RIT45_3034 [Pseudomonadota bacterium]|jgi:hypothetical protein
MTSSLRRSPILSAALILCQIALLTTPALAADGDVERTVVVLELRQGPDPSSLTTDYLREITKIFGVENKGDFILVPTAKVLEKVGENREQVPGALTEERRTALDEARKKGIEYLDRADTSNAIKALRMAESKYRASLAAPGADEKLRKDYLDVLAQLATAYVVAKDEDAAREVFRTVVTSFGPSAPVTDDMYRPDVVQIFQQVVAEMKKMPQGSVDVTSNPLGARVILGGIDRGQTPAQVGSLMPGVYTLRLQQGSNTSMLHRVRVDAGKASKVQIDLPFESHLVLEDGSVGLTYKDMAEARQRLPIDALAIGRSMDVNVIAVCGVVDRKLVTFVVDVGSGRVAQNVSQSVPQIGVSKRAVTRSVHAIMGRSDSSAPADDDSGAWYTSVPGWAATGAGVVALGVGLAFAGSFGDQQLSQCDTDPTLSKESCPAGHLGTPAGVQAANDLKASIESDQTIAGAGILVGTALLAAGGVLFFLKAKSGAANDTALYLQERGVPTLPPLAFGHERTVFSLAQ